MYDQSDFALRHIATHGEDLTAMLNAVGVDSLDELINQVVPPSIRLTETLNIPSALSESQVTGEMLRIAGANRVRRSLRGQGYYGTVTPPVIKRNVFENPAWYTSYTPYQPEISQGRLEALLTFQTLVSELTGLPVANASLLDEGTACAEAMAMSHRVATSKSDVFVIDADIHPQTLAVMSTRAEPLGIKLVTMDLMNESLPDCFGVLACQPGSSGYVKPADALTRVASLAEQMGAIFVIDTDPLFSVLGVPASAVGAQIAVGSMQRFGIPMGYGGPHAAFIATTNAHARSLPGRLVGVSVDSRGNRALRLALQTREQHIRREKATSNICTAQALLANASGFYAMWHGRAGLVAIARRVHEMTTQLAHSLSAAAYEVSNDRWFDTLTIRTEKAHSILKALQDAGFDATPLSLDSIALSLDETITEDDLSLILGAFGAEQKPGRSPLHETDFRHDEFMTQPVFNDYQSEHEMLRYLRRLSDLDLALDRTMIPLGSCTMKLNSTTEMEPITWPGFAALHPYASPEDAKGYAEMISDLERWLCEITGYDAVSLQPNAGSQGEFAGLLAIRAYHRSRGESHRNVCLIPSSAHGTNAASAVMCGMQVVVVACDSAGNVDVADLSNKIAIYGEQLAALMITYPSTHGVFETEIGSICEMVHAAGGQVYVDGANLNALVGLAKPGFFGADVSHLNLHKTFCIPHGGGGPGVGPVAVRSHLAPFLPASHPNDDAGVGMVASAPHGSAGILPIAWAYIRLMGPTGLVNATKHAILHANYIAARLGQAFPILYTGQHGRVAHECILDIRGITKTTGITVDDIAKRLMDFGFHAPTMSFPVAGTLMVEPTESESLRELDRFVDAMLAIADEISDVADGRIGLLESPLRNAPHTVADICDEWSRAYSREIGLTSSRTKQYFPPVNRIDAAFGDRNLVCTCDPIESYAMTSPDEVRREAVQTAH